MEFEGNIMPLQIKVDNKKINEFCRQNHIRKLAFFGSVLRDDFKPTSDVDVLVEFEPDIPMGLIKMAGLEAALSRIIGFKVDLRTAKDLSRYCRDEVLASSEVQYASE